MLMLENRAQNAPTGRLQGSREEGGSLGCKIDQLLAWQGPYQADAEKDEFPC
jgi:hypothetical protein